MPGPVTLARSVGAVDRLAAGDLDGADALVAATGADPEDPDRALWDATSALLRGRLATAAAAVARAGAGLGAAVAGACLLREQDRPAEAELGLRAATEGHPSSVLADALLAVLVAEMGRDAHARPELDRLMAERDPADLAVTSLLAELAADLDAYPEATQLADELAARPEALVVDPTGALCAGARRAHLGRLAHALGRGPQAVAHHTAAIAVLSEAGMPLLVAHARRRLATVLRIWGDDEDWDRSLGLLAAAADAYRRLGLGARAGEAHVVLGRSDDPALGGRLDGVLLRRGDGWVVGTETETAIVGPNPGLDDLALLVAVPRTAVHVLDLWGGLGARAAQRGTDRPWFWPQRPRTTPPTAGEPLADPATVARYEARLAECAAAGPAALAHGDRLAAALAAAERESLAAELAWVSRPPEEGTDVVARAAQVVATRLRLAVDDLEAAVPVVGRHLRYTVRTGTFCSYEPESEVSWRLR